jgi:hypothetical protein
MPQNGILDIEPFDCWGINFMGHFSSSYSHLDTFVFVDYVTKLVEAIPCVTNDAPVVVMFLKKHIFTRFETLRILRSDGGSTLQ